MNEIWRPVVGYEDYYEVSNCGRVRSLDRWVNHSCGGGKVLRKGKILKLKYEKNGYLRVVLSKNGITKMFSIHRLVAEAFIPNPNNYPCVNHKDECKTNNRPENLEWCDYKYNNNYGTRIEKYRKKRSKPVYQYDLQGNLIKCWNSFSECDKYGFFHSLIVKCCQGKRKKHKGYKWSYYPL